MDRQLPVYTKEPDRAREPSLYSRIKILNWMPTWWRLRDSITKGAESDNAGNVSDACSAALDPKLMLGKLLISGMIMNWKDNRSNQNASLTAIRSHKWLSKLCKLTPCSDGAASRNRWRDWCSLTSIKIQKTTARGYDHTAGMGFICASFRS